MSRVNGHCIDCGVPIYRHGSKRCKPCAGRVNSGPNHYGWKGDAALATTKRERAQNAFDLSGASCEFGSCEAPAVDRHHVDGDTGNNDRSNIQFLCRRHHMELDGRLAALATYRRTTNRELAA